MTESSSQHLRHVQDLFEEALTLTPDQRDRFLQQLCSHQPATLAELRRLLRHYSAIEPTLGPVLPTFGVYRATRLIGRGGMGVVYEAERVDGEYTRRVAIKVIAAGVITSFAREELRRERQILASLDHPGIARLFDGGVDEQGAPYQVMEFIDGVHLDRYCDDHQATPHQRLALFQEILAAVEYAHSRGVVHRDLKPSNILVDTQGRTKLLNFGAARFVRSGDTTITARCFTPDFASPELMSGEPVDERTDIYSLAVIYSNLLGKQARQSVLRKAMARNPKDRYATIALFRAALAKSHWPLRIAGSFLAACMLALAFFYAQATHRITVPGATDIWLAAQPAGAKLVGKYGTDQAPKNSPVSLAVVPGHTLSFRASGSVSVDTTCFPSTPNGGCYPDETFFGAGPANGISTYLGPASALIGVFLNTSEHPLAAPSAIDFRAGKHGSNQAPRLNQIFVIGQQAQVTVPAGATHLFLAAADSLGGSEGNLGSFQVAVSDKGSKSKY